MNDSSLPTYLSRGYALSAADVATGLGAELLSLCQTATADGRLEPEELAGLRQWLDDAESARLPAARHLSRVIERVLADGRITPEEYEEVYRALESILPLEARRAALNARLGAQAQDEAAARAVRQRLPDARRRGTRLASATFMVAGVRHQGRAATIAVKLPGGQQLGFVPKDEARQLAPLLDGGCRYTAQISEIIGTSRSRVPVVHADMYRPGRLRERTAVRVALVAALLACVVVALALLRG